MNYVPTMAEQPTLEVYIKQALYLKADSIPHALLDDVIRTLTIKIMDVLIGKDRYLLSKEGRKHNMTLGGEEMLKGQGVGCLAPKIGGITHEESG